MLINFLLSLFIIIYVKCTPCIRQQDYTHSLAVIAHIVVYNIPTKNYISVYKI